MTPAKPAALHARIRAEIEARILAGTLRPGERIPSEAELMAHYGCARMTVNKALSGLATAGLLERRKRAGSFVARPRAQSMVLDVPDLAADVAARGMAYGWQLAERRILLGDGGADAITGRVLAVAGVHLANAVPFAWEERRISLDAVPEIEAVDLSAEAPGGWLLAHVPWTQGENRISAAAAGSLVAARLGVDKDTACLVVARRTWRGINTITTVKQIFLSGSYELVASFGATG